VALRKSMNDATRTHCRTILCSCRRHRQWSVVHAHPEHGDSDSDAAATDAVSVWGITQGSSGTVIADVDNGIRFDHPDLLRAGFGGACCRATISSAKTQFVQQCAVGYFFGGNDGDGWDPDPSDPGDWIDSRT